MLAAPTLLPLQPLSTPPPELSLPELPPPLLLLLLTQVAPLRAPSPAGRHWPAAAAPPAPLPSVHVSAWLPVVLRAQAMAPVLPRLLRDQLG